MRPLTVLAIVYNLMFNNGKWDKLVFYSIILLLDAKLKDMNGVQK